jgi:hypothetical protein
MRKMELVEELFLTACAKVVQLRYNDTEYRNAVCDQCRNPTNGQMEHRCYWQTEESLARERMTCVVYSLQRLSKQVLAAMCQTIRSESPKFVNVTADDVLEFLAGSDVELSPLETVCSRPSWKTFVVDAAMVGEQLTDQLNDPTTSTPVAGPSFLPLSQETQDAFGLI